ncbi:uncharacterized protein LOC129921124 [Episyrphus balteatus]|uniref:uncharacterized protein LOC129921124 n=1 Tax=Episyrphus balteatus TaxID=286459 RepID=UPI002486C40B|nr:uncharacterized protein LOC129921124 [Episyrphus balteatus]
MFTVERLCCLRLNTAGVVVGWVCGILSLFYIVLYALLISNLDEIIKYIVEQGGSPAEKLDPSTVRSVVIAIVAIALTICVVNLISSVLLVAGTIQERHMMLVPWLINNGFALSLSVLNLIYFIVSCIHVGKSFGMIFGMTLGLLIPIAIQYYIWTAIYSLFRVIRSSRERQQLIPPTTGAAGTAYPSYTRI